METISGLGKKSRLRLAEVLRQTKGTVTVQEAANILQIPPTKAAKMLSQWTTQGWVSRVKRGVYVFVPLEAKTPQIVLDDPWVVAERLFEPCYIGGWSAAEYWGLTEQIFRTVMVMTTRKSRNRKPVIKGTAFLLRTVPGNAMFGLKPVWRDQVKVNVSDSARTVLDMLSNPSLGGGLRPTVDVFRAYMDTEEKNIELLIQYADRLNNSAIFKRMGYLTTLFAKKEQPLISACRQRLRKGNSKIDPALPADKLVTVWNLWVPNNWGRGLRFDQ